MVNNNILETFKFILDVKKDKDLPVQSLPIAIDVKKGEFRSTLKKIKKDFLKDNFSVKVRNISKRK